MLRNLNKVLFNHSFLLSVRKWRKSLFQLLPSIMFSFLFAQIYYVAFRSQSDQNYIWVYFFLSLILVLFISAVIYYRESSIELNSFYYLVIIGFRKREVWLIVFIKWILLFLTGFILAICLFVFLNLQSISHFEIDVLLNIILLSFLLNQLLLIGIVFSIIQFNRHK